MHYSVFGLLVAFIAGASCFPSGAPEGCCYLQDPVAGHGPSSNSNSGRVPYQLVFSSSTYSPGQKINVTMVGINGETFKGYSLQARSVSRTDPFGYFNDAPSYQTMCNYQRGNGVTHRFPNVKESETFVWEPTQYAGDVYFYFTVVRGGAPSSNPNLEDYFKQIRSGPLKPAHGVKAGVFSYFN